MSYNFAENMFSFEDREKLHEKCDENILVSYQITMTRIIFNISDVILLLFFRVQKFHNGLVFFFLILS